MPDSPPSPSLHARWVGGDDQGAAGAPVVAFLHGLFGQGKNFTTIARGLAPQFRSLLIDLPNHGRSPWTDAFDYPDIADRVADFLRREVADDLPLHLVGHSLGGKVAMVLALRHPDLIDRLVVVDISPAASSGVGQFEQLLGALANLDLDGLDSRSAADSALSGPIPDAVVRSFLLQNLHQESGRWAWRPHLELLRSSLSTIGDFPDLAGATFDHPTLWIAGQRSNYIDASHSEMMRALFPRVISVTIKNAGHWVHSEQPEAFILTLRRFLTPSD